MGSCWGPPSAQTQHSVNKWAARIIPAILIGIVGFATWVIIVLIAVNYLLHPPQSVPRRHGAAIAVITIYCVLLLLMAITYLRVLQVVATNPGVVPSQHLEEEKQSSRKGKQHSKTTRKTSREHSNVNSEASAASADYLDRGAIYGGRQRAPNGLEQYYNRDMFECEIDGMPRFCSTCKIWKPDRSHHSSEVGRCVYKMDHFCPWAGGIISETSYKFFMIFLFYGMLYCMMTLVVSVYYTVLRHRAGGSDQITWIVTIALAGLFFFFSFGMLYTSLISVFQNTTTVDAFTRANRIYYFAVLIPEWHPLVQVEYARRASPDPLAAAKESLPPDAVTPFATITYPLLDPSSQPSSSTQRPRVFAILPALQGSNPYRLDSASANFKEVFGNQWYQWFVPLRHSPCADHSAHGVRSGREDGAAGDPASMYPFGGLMTQMKRDAGLLPRTEKVLETDRYGRRSIRQHSSS